LAALNGMFAITTLRTATARMTHPPRDLFIKNNLQHPTYKAFVKLGRAVKAVFPYISPR
jgi:TnpA family transposase